jgi:hypothetical protein
LLLTTQSGWREKRRFSRDFQHPVKGFHSFSRKHFSSVWLLPSSSFCCKRYSQNHHKLHIDCMMESGERRTFAESPPPAAGDNDDRRIYAVLECWLDDEMTRLYLTPS